MSGWVTKAIDWALNFTEKAAEYAAELMEETFGYNQGKEEQQLQIARFGDLINTSPRQMNKGLRELALKQENDKKQQIEFVKYVSMKSTIATQRKENILLSAKKGKKKRRHDLFMDLNQIAYIVIIVECIILAFLLFGLWNNTSEHRVEEKGSQARLYLILEKAATLKESIKDLEDEKRKLSITIERGVRKLHEMHITELQQSTFLTQTALIVMASLFILSVGIYTCYFRNSQRAVIEKSVAQSETLAVSQRTSLPRFRNNMPQLRNNAGGTPLSRF